MIWHFIKYIVTLIIPTFYKRIQGRNIHLLHQKGPAIIAMNHPNAFTDPILITYLCYPERTWYMARGDAFKPGFISGLLTRIGIVPIFRIQDGGREGLKKNDDAYRLVNGLLKKKRKVIVFAEGLCVQERRLRPLKKGVARMVFGAYEQLKGENLLVYPVGVNYSQPEQFRTDVFYNVGAPISVKDFIPLYAENPAKANNAFLQVLDTKMKELITHIDDKNHDETVLMAETLCKKDMLKEQGLNQNNLGDDFDVLKQITEKVNRAAVNNATLVNEFKAEGHNYFAELKKQRLEDWLIDPEQNKNVGVPMLIFNRLLLIFFFPIHLAGLAGNYLPLKLTGTLAGKVAKNKEFYSSMWIGFAIFVFFFNYLLWFIVIYSFSDTVGPPIAILLLLGLCGWFSLYYYPLFSKTVLMGRALKNPDTVDQLLQKRIALITLINKF